MRLLSLLFGRKASPRPSNPRRFRPTLMFLEGREVPAILLQESYTLACDWFGELETADLEVTLSDTDHGTYLWEYKLINNNFGQWIDDPGGSSAIAMFGLYTDRSSVEIPEQLKTSGNRPAQFMPNGSGARIGWQDWNLAQDYYLRPGESDTLSFETQTADIDTVLVEVVDAMAMAQATADVAGPLLSQFGRIQGRVTLGLTSDSGATRGLEGVPIEVNRDGQLVATTTSDADGNFRVTGLPVGTYTVTAQSPIQSPYISLNAGTTVQVTGGADTAQIELVADDWAAFREYRMLLETLTALRGNLAFSVQQIEAQRAEVARLEAAAAAAQDPVAKAGFLEAAELASAIGGEMLDILRRDVGEYQELRGKALDLLTLLTWVDFETYNPLPRPPRHGVADRYLELPPNTA